MIVGFVGKARSGKDTAANYLVEKHGFTRIAFADPIKEAAKHIFGWTDRHVYGDLKEVVCPYWGFTPRWALQFMGTEMFRNMIRDDFWIHRANKTIIDNPGKDWVFSDVRFLNEAEYINKVGFAIKILRDGAEASGGIDGHQSEMEIDLIATSSVVHNDKTIDDLYQVVKELVFR